MDALFLAWSVLFLVTFTPLLSGGMDKVTDVRLVKGRSRYEGTVEYTTNNAMWQTTCGANFGFRDARLVCEHIGAYGTNKAITNSPFGSDLGPATTYLQCNDDHTTISQCSLLSCSSSTIGAAICYDDDSYLGCFMDDKNNRVLPGDQLIENSTMTIDKCISHCRESTMADYVYAGMLYGEECFCGVAGTDYSRLGAAENGDADCQTPCTGDTYSSCGGNGHIAVFQIPESSHPVTTHLTSSEEIDTSPAATTTTANKHSSTTDTTTSTCPSQPTQLSASPSNGPNIGLGVVVLLFAMYSVTLTVLHLKLRRCLREKQPLEGVKPEGDTYTDLDIQLHSATPENRASLYQDLLPIEGAPNPPNQSPMGMTDMDTGCYVNQQMTNPLEAMRQRAKPEGDQQHYEDFV